MRHDSFRTQDFVDMARRHEIAIVMAGDSDYPQIADPTASFVYARIMGTEEAHPLGYAKKTLDVWAERAKTYAAGGVPKDLSSVGADPKAEPRDVFLYVISGHKARNPAAAMALIERLRSG